MPVEPSKEEQRIRSYFEKVEILKVFALGEIAAQLCRANDLKQFELECAGHTFEKRT